MKTPFSNRRVVSMMVLVFIAGAAAGVIGDRLSLGDRPRIRTVVSDMSPVFDRLGLTAEQRLRAEAIVTRSAPRSAAIMMETAERLRAVADSVDSELRAILTAEQRLRLDSLRREPMMVLKRKVQTSGGGARTDTLYPARQPSPR